MQVSAYRFNSMLAFQNSINELTLIWFIFIEYMKSVICDTTASTKTEEKTTFEQNTFLVHFLRFRIVIKGSRGQIYCMVGNLPLHGRQIESWVFIPPFLSAFPAKGQSNLIKEKCNRIGTGRKRGRHPLNNLTPSFIQMALLLPKSQFFSLWVSLRSSAEERM